MEASDTAVEGTVADAVIDVLAGAGVTDVFGVAGSTIMPLLDAIGAHDGIGYVPARYEQSAADMASGYARTSGRLGIVLTHVGPGATSCVTTIAAAARDGIPMLLITGNEESETLVREPYHDWDIMRAMDAVVGFSYRVTRVDEVPHVLRRALGQATRANPQPVHIDLPEDIGLQPLPPGEAARWGREIGPLLDALAGARSTPATRTAPTGSDIARVADLLAAATSPVLLLGETVSRGNDPEAVLRRCEKLGVPFAAAYGARGGIGERPGYVGTLGRFGSRESTAFVASADCVVSLGAELSDVDTVRWSIPGLDAHTVVVHPDARKVDLRIPSDIGIVSDPEEFLDALLTELSGRATSWSPGWFERAASVDHFNGPVGDTMAGGSSGATALDANLVGSAIAASPESWALAVDPGFGALTLTSSARLGARRFLYPYGFGYMGFAVPAAIGAVVSGEVEGAIAVIGDGSFFMSMASVESVASLDVPVLVVVLDDGGFGSQRKKQREAYAGRNVGVDYQNPDIARIGSALGLDSRWVTSAAEVEELSRELPVRKRGGLVVVPRDRDQTGTWYEGSHRSNRA